MKCIQFRDLLDEYMDFEMNEKARRQMDAHAETCSDCRERLLDRERLFHCMNESVELNVRPNFTEGVMKQIRELPLPKPPNPLFRPFLAALVTALFISGALVIIGYNSLPAGISPVDIIKLITGSIQLPDGLQASMNEMWAFLGVTWTVFRILIQVIVQIAAIVIFKLPKTIPMVFIVFAVILGIWWYRRQRKGIHVMGLWLTICLLLIAGTTTAAPIGDSPDPEAAVPTETIELQAEITDLETALEDVSESLASLSDESNGVFMFNSATVHADEIRNGDLVVFGGSADLAGVLTGDLVVFGGSARITGHVGGDAVVIGGSVTVGPAARVDGDLVAVGGVVRRHEGAVIQGQSIIIGGKGIGIDSDLTPPSLGFLSLGFKLTVLITWFVLAFIVTLLFTRSIENTIDVALQRPTQSILAGFIFHVSSLLVCLILFVIIIGIPLSLLGFVLWVLTGVFGTTAGFVLMGRLIMDKLKKGYANTLLLLLIGFIILAAIRFVPFSIGWTLWQLWGMAGIGATILSRFGSNKPWFGYREQPLKNAQTKMVPPSPPDPDLSE